MATRMKLGKFIWYLQRYTAIYFLLFFGYLNFIVFTDSFSFQFLNESLTLKVLLSIFIILACLHGFAGLWTVSTDYLTKRTLSFVSSFLATYANFLRISFELIFVLLGIILIIFYLLIIWS